MKESLSDMLGNTYNLVPVINSFVFVLLAIHLSLFILGCLFPLVIRSDF